MFKKHVLSNSKFPKSTLCDEFSLISISINGAEAGDRIGTIGMMLMMIMQSARRKDSQREGAAENTKNILKSTKLSEFLR